MEQPSVCQESTHQQFITHGTHYQNIATTIHITPRLLQLSLAKDAKYGRIIMDSGADTGSLNNKYCHITYTSIRTVDVAGCHPSLCKTYPLASGITAIDLPNGPLLVGQHEVPLISESNIMLLSEVQLRSAGIDLETVSKHFGGRGAIFLDDHITLPL